MNTQKQEKPWINTSRFSLLLWQGVKEENATAVKRILHWSTNRDLLNSEINLRLN